MKLRDIAHDRTGDKGNVSNIAVIAYSTEGYGLMEKYLTEERVKGYLSDFVKGNVRRYCLPELGALNFVMEDTLGGGVTRSLAMDAHGKSLSFALLNLEIPEKQD
jgi:hypothetical protein